MKNKSITEPRFHYKLQEGFEYPEYYDAWEIALTSVWNHKEVPMGEDVINWQMATESERQILGGILRAFTQIECVIGDYWATFVPKVFKKPEIIMMCSAFSFFETIHQAAYNHLSSTLNIDEYTEYIGDPIAQQKVEYLLEEISSPKVKLAIFSGGAEGVALFSAFSILLSFCKESKFKGLSQIISWSILDEAYHSDMGCELFKELVKEQGITDEEIELIIEGLTQILKNEYAFLNNVFGELPEINKLSKESFFEFLKSRYNDRIEKLGLSPKNFLEYDKELSFNISSWFISMANGNVSQDFFAYSKDGGQYVSKPIFDINKINWDNISLV